MSTDLLGRPAAAPRPNACPSEPPPGIGFANLLRSEWTKLISVRSTLWTGVLTVLAVVALGAVLCWRWVDVINNDPPGKLGTFDPTLTAISGIYLAQVAVGALGVLVISSEYRTGMIRTTLSAVPQRRLMLAAKGLVFVVVTLVVGEILSFTAAGVGLAILARARHGASLSQPDVLRATVGGGLYLATVGLLGFGLGALIRHTAGALSALFGVLFATSTLIDLLPDTWRQHLLKFAPANAGSQIITVYPTRNALGPWTGLAVLLAYAVVAVGAAVVLIEHRDA